MITSKQLQSLYDSGLSIKQVGDAVGLSQAATQRRFVKFGIKARTLRAAQVNAWAKGTRKFNSPTGDKHWLWKGGMERRGYRKMIKKERCDECGGRINLCIHHKDFDHFNNAPDNLQVLCVSCHLSYHRKEYLKARREGRTPKTSTRPHHWNK